jgi:hypothetical protein
MRNIKIMFLGNKCVGLTTLPPSVNVFLVKDSEGSKGESSYEGKKGRRFEVK